MELCDRDNLSGHCKYPCKRNSARRIAVTIKRRAGLTPAAGHKCQCESDLYRHRRVPQREETGHGLFISVVLKNQTFDGEV